MSDNERSIFWICVILTMAMAFTALMISLPRTVRVDDSVSLDYQGTIVAIFSLLVTILLGWQIYSALEIAKRVRRNEGRVNVARSHVEHERQRIDHLAQISQGYNDGNYFSLLALVQYYEVEARRRGGNIEAPDAVHHLCSCYMMSARAMTHYFDALDTNPQLLEDISIAVRGCVQTFELSSIQLFHSRYADFIADVFRPQDHATCDSYYRNIMQHSDALQSEHIDIINNYRVQRRALLIN